MVKNGVNRRFLDDHGVNGFLLRGYSPIFGDIKPVLKVLVKQITDLIWDVKSAFFLKKCGVRDRVKC